jgi:hypothetical protein
MDMFIRLAKRTVGVGGILIAVAAAAQAQGPQQFASFTQADPSNKPFRFFFDSVTPSNSRFGLYDGSGNAVSIAVNFQYQVFNGYGAEIGENIAATMTMTSRVFGTTVGDDDLVQDFQEVSMVFTANTPVNGLTNLLTVTAVLSSPPIDPDIPFDNGTLGTTGRLSASIGDSTGSFRATESSTLNRNYIGYTSSFLDFVNPTFTNRNFSLAIGNITDPVARGTGSPAENYFNNFVSSASGTFGSDPIPAVPEPGSLALLSVGLSGTALFVRRRKMRNIA